MPMLGDRARASRVYGCEGRRCFSGDLVALQRRDAESTGGCVGGRRGR
jgi:hypothetical protein